MSIISTYSPFHRVSQGWALARSSADPSPVLIFLKAPTSGTPGMEIRFRHRRWHRHPTGNHGKKGKRIQRMILEWLALSLQCSSQTSSYIVMLHNFSVFHSFPVFSAICWILFDRFVAIYCASHDNRISPRFVSQIVVHLIHQGHPGTASLYHSVTMYWLSSCKYSACIWHAFFSHTLNVIVTSPRLLFLNHLRPVATSYTSRFVIII